MEFRKFSFVSLSHLHSHEAKYTSSSFSSDKPKVVWRHYKHFTIF